MTAALPSTDRPWADQQRANREAVELLVSAARVATLHDARAVVRGDLIAALGMLEPGMTWQRQALRLRIDAALYRADRLHGETQRALARGLLETAVSSRTGGVA